MNYERRGVLHPQYVVRAEARGQARRVTVYDPKELIKLPQAGRAVAPREPGETTARAFELFDTGKSVKQVIVEMRETSENIEALHDKWFNLEGANHVISPVAWEAFEKLVGPFKDVTELLELVTKKLAE